MAEKTPSSYDTTDADAPESGGVVADRMGFYEVAQPKRGRTKQRFKQTEVGALPIDWHAAKISDVCKLINGRGFKPHEWSREGLPIIRIQNLNGSPEFNHYKGSYDPKIEVHQSQLLFAWSGSRGTSFGPHVWNGPKALLNYHTWKVVVDDETINRAFFLHALKKLTAYIEDRAHGASALVHTQKREMEHFHFAMPPTKTEQRAIATTLSDVDELLGALDRLIAKKRDLKQAAMQELLTGKRRLPGFTKPWETKTLGEVGLISGAGVDKKIRPNEVPVRLVNYMDVYRRDFIYSGELDHHVTARVDQAQRCAVQAGDVFFTPTSEVRNDIGHSAVAMEDIPDAAYSYHVVRLRLKDDWDLQFRAYAFKTKAFMDQASTLCEGSGTRYVITLPKFRSMSVNVPSDKHEQAAIANILSDMDEEIATLESRREKTKALKQGMMQELLTGRIRLVKPEGGAC